MATQTPTRRQTLYSDFLSDFRTNPSTNDLVVVTNEQSVIQSLKKIIRTNHFEIPYNPYFGANINRKLFENYTSLTEVEVKNDIQLAIDNFEPRVNVIDITIGGDPDSNRMTITLTVSIINTTTQLTISTILTRVR